MASFYLRWLSIFGVATTAFHSFAVQAAPNEFQVWPAIKVSATSDRLETTTDAIFLFTDQSSRLRQFLIRGVLTYQLTDELAAGGGYTYTTLTDSLNLQQSEHRIVQDILYRPSIEHFPLEISFRVRAEERFREHATQTAYRLRQLTRIDVPLIASGIEAVIWNETFYALNGTTWSGLSGISQTINFGGLKIQISEKATVETGYLSYIAFAAGQNRMAHTLSAVVSVRL